MLRATLIVLALWGSPALAGMCGAPPPPPYGLSSDCAKSPPTCLCEYVGSKVVCRFVWQCD